MKLRDWLTLAAIVGGLALMFFFTRHIRPEHVEAGSPEYDAYIERYVAECLQNRPLVQNASSARAMPSEAEREAACRAGVFQADRLNPDARPLKH